ncbi:MAG: D-alanine--D-alanine ligase [Fimbriimonadaceae bacterium]
MRTPTEIATAFAPRESLQGYSSFYLVGIGGAGMSGIALMLQRRGFAVRGSDSTPSPTTAELETSGIQVRIGHSGEGIREGDAVVLSDAIDIDSSPEVARARELGCRLFRRSQVLGWLLRGKKVIAVTGTHGKTTTTGMIGAGLRAASMDPTIVVGAVVPEFGGAVVEGTGEWAVVEACEAYDSFHDIDPTIVVLTNLEADHLDYHGSWEALRNSVLRFAASVPEDGYLVYCSEDAGARDVADRVLAEKLGYGGLMLENAALPGRHNALNATGAFCALRLILGDPSAAAAGIAEFRGAERRLQLVKEGSIVVIDDYAHHPSEVEAGIQALRDRYPGQRIVVVFQPHLYSRTAQLIPEFARALNHADRVVLTDIYPAREEPIPGISSARMAELVTVPCAYIPSRHLLPREVALMARSGDVVVGMGAGNIAEFAPAFLKELDRIAAPSNRHTSERMDKVAVIYGGDSAEREVSLHSGIEVQDALRRRGYEAKLYDVTELLLSRGDVGDFIGPNRPDLAFLAVHGTHAEDGAVQGFFELLHIPYTGSGIQSSAIAMDKRLTKQVLEAEGIRVPDGVLLQHREQILPVSLRPPLIVKPNAQGSTVGLSFVSKHDELQPSIERAFQYDSAVLVEEWIEGIEISVPVLGDRALPVVEIVPGEGRYDFAAKYTPGATEEIVPARLPIEVAKKAQEIALRCHNALRCEGATRTDMIVRNLPHPTPSPFVGTKHLKNGEGVSGPEIFVLELNTLPGMTATSLLPNSARSAGIEFGELCDWIVQDALRRHGAKT